MRKTPSALCNGCANPIQLKPCHGYDPSLWSPALLQSGEQTTLQQQHPSLNNFW